MPKQISKAQEYNQNRQDSKKYERLFNSYYTSDLQINQYHQYQDQFKLPSVTIKFPNNQNSYDFNHLQLKSPSFFIQSSFRKDNLSRPQRSGMNQSYIYDNQLDGQKQKVSSFDGFHYDRSGIRSNTKNELRQNDSIQRRPKKSQFDNSIQELMEQLSMKLEQILISCQAASQSHIPTNIMEDWFKEDNNSSGYFQLEEQQLKESFSHSNITQEPFKLFETIQTVQHQLSFVEHISLESKNLALIQSKSKEMQQFINIMLAQKTPQQNAENLDNEEPTMKRQAITNKFQKIYRCQYCKVGFLKACSLGGHISRVHKNESIRHKLISKTIAKAQFNKIRNSLLENFIKKQTLNYM